MVGLASHLSPRGAQYVGVSELRTRRAQCITGNMTSKAFVRANRPQFLRASPNTKKYHANRWFHPRRAQPARNVWPKRAILTYYCGMLWYYRRNVTHKDKSANVRGAKHSGVPAIRPPCDKPALRGLISTTYDMVLSSTWYYLNPAKNYPMLIPRSTFFVTRRFTWVYLYYGPTPDDLKMGTPVGYYCM